MNIWIISLFEPTPLDKSRPMRYMGIAEAAVKKGHHVTHFSCTFRHSTKVQRFSKTQRESVNPNYELIFIYAPSYKKNISFQRLRSHRVFTLNLLKELEKVQIKPDRILVAYPPISPLRVLTKWGEENGVPVIIDVIDPWPDVFLTLLPKSFRFLGKLILTPFYRNLAVSIKKVKGVTAISSEYISWANAINTPIKYSSVFLPSVPFQEVQEKIAKVRSRHDGTHHSKLKVIYAGNLGKAYDLPTILEAARTLEQDYQGKTEFIIAGKGYYEDLIQKYASSYPNINYLGRIEYDELMYQYSKANLGLAQYPARATQSVTYKFFDYLSAGLPIMNSLQSEMAELIGEYSLGLNNEPGNAVELAKNIRYFLDNPEAIDVYKERALKFTEEHGDNEKVYANFVDFITLVN